MLQYQCQVFSPNYLAISIAAIIFPIGLSCLYLYLSSQSSGAGEEEGASKWEELGHKANVTLQHPGISELEGIERHYTDEKNEVQLDEVNCPRSHSMSVQETQVGLRMGQFNGLFSHHAACDSEPYAVDLLFSRGEKENFRIFQPFMCLVFQCLGPGLLSFSWDHAPIC